MAKPRQTIDLKRRKPHQARAAETVNAILEASAQVLEAGGLDAFTTNAVAERAGVSIGTLYQYFADKNAVLRALAQREVEATLANVAKALNAGAEPSLEGRLRAVVHAMINAFRGRQRARRAVALAVMAQGFSVQLFSPVATFLGARGEYGNPDYAPLTQEQIFVLSRSLMGVVRAAMLEDQPFFKSRTFEDELVRMMLAYFAAIRTAARS
jgi:AcrR family transcriptional regulator